MRYFIKAKARTGEQIYRQSAASCHGAGGEGTDEHYPRPLIGERSVAEAVSDHRQDDARGRPGSAWGRMPSRSPPISMRRSTRRPRRPATPSGRPDRALASDGAPVRNAVADLIGSFRGAGRWDDYAGLKADRGQVRRGRRGGSRRQQPGARRRGDPLRFRDGQPHPRAERVQRCPALGPAPVLLVPVSFRSSRRISGSTGRARCWRPRPASTSSSSRRRTPSSSGSTTSRPLIDASVKSGNDTEYRESIRLLGGRVYRAAGVLAGKEKKTSVDRLSGGSSRGGPRGDPAAEPLAPPRPRDLRPEDAVPARRPQRRLRARHVDLEGVGPGDDRRGDRGGRLRRAHLKELAGIDERRRPDRETKLRDFCRRFAERLPSAARRRAEGVLHRPPVQGGPRPGGGQAGRAPGPQVAPVPLSRARQRRPDAFDVASRLSFGLWDSLPDRPLLGRGRLAAGSHAASRSPTRPGAWSPDLAPAPSSASSSSNGCKVDQGPEMAKDPKLFPGFDEAVVSDLREFARAVPRRRHRRARPPISAAAARELPLPERAAGAVLRRRPPARRAVPEGQPGAAAAGRRPDPPLPDVQLRLHGVELAHPSRGVRLPERAGPGAEAAAGGRRPAGRRPPPGPDDPPARRRSRPSPSLPVVPRPDQSPGFTLEHYDAIGRYRNEKKGGRSTPPAPTRPAPATASSSTASPRSPPSWPPAKRPTPRCPAVVPLSGQAANPRVWPTGAARSAPSFAAHDYNIRKLMVEIMASSALAPRDRGQKRSVPSRGRH